MDTLSGHGRGEGMFFWPVLFSGVILAGSWWTGGPRVLAGVALLAVLEVSMSFDNAIVDATVLRRLPRFWQRVYLTAGVAVAVVGMRFALPLLFVCGITGLPPQAAVGLAVKEPAIYHQIIGAAEPALIPFGEIYLLMIFLDFVFESREVNWLRPVEQLLARLGRVENLAVVLAIAAIGLTAAAEGRHHLTILLSGLAGLVTYLAVNGVASAFVPHDEAGGPVRGRQALVLFCYLEILDASFSFDGVIGAFAISHDILVIAAGLGIGALFVRTLTLQLVRRGVLSEFVYLEHGAHWAIGALAVTMIIKFRYDVNGTVTGLVGVAFILAALISSARARRYVPHHARRAGRDTIRTRRMRSGLLVIVPALALAAVVMVSVALPAADPAPAGPPDPAPLSPAVPADPAPSPMKGYLPLPGVHH